MIIHEIFQIFKIAFSGMWNAIFNSILEMLPTINLLNDIAGAFSWQQILCYSLGISSITLTIITIILKLILKKIKNKR